MTTPSVAVTQPVPRPPAQLSRSSAAANPRRTFRPPTTYSITNAMRCLRRSFAVSTAVVVIVPPNRTLSDDPIRHGLETRGGARPRLAHNRAVSRPAQGADRPPAAGKRPVAHLGSRAGAARGGCERVVARRGQPS